MWTKEELAEYIKTHIYLRFNETSQEEEYFLDRQPVKISALIQKLKYQGNISSAKDFREALNSTVKKFSYFPALEHLKLFEPLSGDRFNAVLNSFACGNAFYKKVWIKFLCCQMSFALCSGVRKKPQAFIPVFVCENKELLESVLHMLFKPFGEGKVLKEHMNSKRYTIKSIDAAYAIIDADTTNAFCKQKRGSYLESTDSVDILLKCEDQNYDKKNRPRRHTFCAIATTREAVDKNAKTPVLVYTEDQMMEIKQQLYLYCEGFWNNILDIFEYVDDELDEDFGSSPLATREKVKQSKREQLLNLYRFRGGGMGGSKLHTSSAQHKEFCLNFWHKFVSACILKPGKYQKDFQQALSKMVAKKMIPSGILKYSLKKQKRLCLVMLKAAMEKYNSREAREERNRKQKVDKDSDL